jgi:hypothetical protein
MDEDKRQLERRARDLASRLDALDLYDMAGHRAVIADIADFGADLRRVYNPED